MLDLDLVLNEVEGRGLLRAPRRVHPPELEGCAVLEGETDVWGLTVTLWIVLVPGFPLNLPQFFLRPWDALGFLPHVLPNGYICFADAEGLVQDRRDPTGVVEEALSRALALLGKGAAGLNQTDFIDEFQVYWGRLPNTVVLTSVLELNSQMRWVLTAQLPDDVIVIAGSENEITDFRNGNPADIQTVGRALYVPLEPGALLVPPRHDRPFWNAKEARRALLPHLSDLNRAKLRNLIGGLARKSEYVLFNLPNQQGGSSLFGIRYDGIGRNHPLLDSGVAELLVPIAFDRLDRGYIIARGGGDEKLAVKRVLLVGCGAVGGPLAFELSRAGILDLTLVDFDKLKPENTFRFPVGRGRWGMEKVEILKTEIERSLPYVRVTTVPNYIEYALASGTVQLSDYDLVVLATGKPTVELEINAQLRSKATNPPAVFTWLEPLGIGGHALLTGNRQNGGCYECLYTPPDGDIERNMDNRASFAAPGQSFGRVLNGCGSLHTPYGSVDATRTAALAACLSVDVLTGREAGNPLRSWKGDATEFERAGFRVSPRFLQSQDALIAQQYNYPTNRCRTCGT